MGFLVFGLALANAYPTTTIDREIPLLGWLFVAQIAWAIVFGVGGATIGWSLGRTGSNL